MTGLARPLRAAVLAIAMTAAHLAAATPALVPIDRVRASQPSAPIETERLRGPSGDERYLVKLAPDGKMSTYSVNPATGRIVDITARPDAVRDTYVPVPGGWETSLDKRIRFRGRLLSARVDLDRGSPGPSMVRVQVIDEHGGAVVRELKLEANYFTGTFLGVDRRGALKLLVASDDVFGLLDVASGAYRELVPRDQHGLYRANSFPMRFGRFVQFRGAHDYRLYDFQELLEGRVQPVRVDLRATVPLGDPATARLAATALDRGVSVWELATGKQVGPVLQSNDGAFDAIDAGGRTVIVMRGALHPSTYVPGTVFTYFDARSGQQLRTRSSDDWLSEQLLAGPSGRIYSVEWWGASQRQKGYALVDVLDDKVLASSDSIELWSAPFLSTANAPRALRVNEHGQVCVVDLLAPTQEACATAEPGLQGFAPSMRPYVIAPGHVVLPTPAPDGNVLGIVSFRVD